MAVWVLVPASEWVVACIAVSEAVAILVAMRVATQVAMVVATQAITATEAVDSEVATIQEEVTPALDTGRITTEDTIRAVDRTTIRADLMAATIVSHSTRMDITEVVATEAVAMEAMASLESKDAKSCHRDS